jgi:hypothetical protein
MAPPHLSKAPEALVNRENKLQLADPCVQGQQRTTHPRSAECSQAEKQIEFQLSAFPHFSPLTPSTTQSTQTFNLLPPAARSWTTQAHRISRIACLPWLLHYANQWLDMNGEAIL